MSASDAPYVVPAGMRASDPARTAAKREAIRRRDAERLERRIATLSAAVPAPAADPEPGGEAALRDTIRAALAAAHRAWLDRNDEQARERLIDLLSLRHRGAIGQAEFTRALAELRRLACR